MGLAEIFGESEQKRSKTMDIANFLRFLATLLDDNEDQESSLPDSTEEVPTRPHFTPSGG